MDGLLYSADPGGLFHFIVLSLAIGGVLAIAAGKAIASTWRSFWIVPLYMIVLAAAVRFLHYALFGEDLLNLQYYLISLVVVLLASAYGYRSERARQMATQYGWLFKKTGPLGWTPQA